MESVIYYMDMNTTLLQKTFSKFMKRPAIIVVVVLIVSVGSYFFFIREKKPLFNTMIAQRGNIVQEVSVTGRVKPARSVELAFEKGGRVSAARVDIGDRVFVGQTLVSLENADLLAELAQAEAGVKLQQAKLDELRRGTRLEEIEVGEARVKNARQSLVDELQGAYTKSDDAVRSKTDQLFSSPRSENPQLNFTVTGGIQLETDIEGGRALVEKTLISWSSSLNNLTVLGDLEAFVDEAKINLNQIKSFLDKVALAVNALTPNTALTQTTIDGYRSNIFTARTNVNTAISNVSGAESDFIIQGNELALKKAGTVVEQITAQEALVEDAEASVRNSRAKIAKTIIRSPIKGVVTKQDAKVGEIVSASVVIVSVISEANFEIEANIPEADIAKIKIGNVAKVTLDAYGSDVVFKARVANIEPAETIIEGIAIYKTTLQFFEDDTRIKSGLTANIDILADKKENVITIPLRAVITKNGDSIVRILKDRVLKEIKVKTGLRGSYGNVEVIEGVNEGDEVILFIRE